MDVPFLFAELVDQLLERGRIAQRSGRTSEVKQVLAVEVAESGEELLTEDGTQNRNRQQEHGMAGMNPALAIGRQSAAGNHGMDMVMEQQVRSP